MRGVRRLASGIAVGSPLLGALALLAAPARADNGLRPARFATPITLRLDFHVAVGGSNAEPRPVVDRAFIDSTVARASEIWAQAGILFRLGRVRLLPRGKHLYMWSRGNRHALARTLPESDGAVDVFVVHTIVDLERSTVSLPGVHWHSYFTRGGRYYVILGSRSVGVETLAHELGHHFGLDHVPSRVNIMRPGSGRRDARLTRRQIRRAQQRLAYFLEKGMVRPVEGEVPSPPGIAAGAASGPRGQPPVLLYAPLKGSRPDPR